MLTHQPCSNCGSSDALTEYDDHTYCFSCKEFSWLNDFNKNDLTFNQDCATLSLLSNTISTLKKEKEVVNTYSKAISVPYREIPISVLNRYKIKGNYDSNTNDLFSIEYPYGTDASKVRIIPRKEFYSIGKMMDTDVYLFGMDVFSPGSDKSITITEGENDAMSVHAIMGTPAVSVKSASTARRDCERAYKYLNSFDSIYLCLDNDGPGQEAAKEIAKLFDVNKVYHVELGAGCKDANDYLTQGRSAEFYKLWKNSKRWLPKGIVNANSEVEEILRRSHNSSIASYPFPTLQEMTYGIREGEVILFTAQEGIGKTEIIRAIEYSLCKETDKNIGIIHLEEEEKRSVQGLLSYELNVPVHLDDSNVSIEEQIEAYKRMVRQDGRLHYYTHFGSDDPDIILDMIRYLVSSCHCKFVFLDHITMLVTGFEGEDERRKLDYLSTRLAMLTRELRFTLFLVSHVNDEGKTRGSRNISKVADLVVYLNRDPEAATFDKRNTTELLVKKNRFAAKSGPAGYLKFDPSTYKIAEASIEEVVEEMPF